MTDLQAMLIAQECRGGVIPLHPYPDTRGKLTIGVGRNLTDKGISNDEALAMLSSDIADAIDDVRHCCSVYDELSRPRQLVLVSMAVNLGRAGLNAFVRFLNAIHLSDWNQAADEIRDSTAAKQAPVRYQQLETMMRENTSEWV